jgi:hypothetical protein
LTTGLILLLLAALLLGISGWLWLCAGFRRGGWRGGLGVVALQISAVCLIYGLLRGQPMAGLFTALFPPLVLAEIADLVRFRPFLHDLGWGMAPYATAGLMASLVIRPLRMWSLALMGVAAMGAAVLVGDQISQAAMCQTAAKRGFDRFDRSSFAASLAFAPQEFQFDLHARAEDSGQVLGWSYSTMDWYVIPDRAQGNVTAGAAFHCAT